MKCRLPGPHDPAQAVNRPVSIASAPITADRRLLFNQVLAWGLSMSVVGAVGCYVAFGKW